MFSFQFLWLPDRDPKDESQVAQEADAQAEEEAQEDARQVQVDRRCDLFLDGDGGDCSCEDGTGARTLKALAHALSRRISVSS